MINENNILRHELIGLNVEIASSLNPLNNGINGKVVDESQQTITIRTNKGDKKVLKSISNFIFKSKNNSFKVKGLKIIKRPWERVKI
ncbi:MAG: ribonuclease P protein subunit [Candidatus Woesearchaeota archaeon]|jgi:ribonuclease P protein subunit POP4